MNVKSQALDIVVRSNHDMHASTVIVVMVDFYVVEMLECDIRQRGILLTQ